MLIPRQLQQQQHSTLGKISVKNFNDSGLEVKPIYKKMAQHSHVNKLLHTAAAGNGVIDDVDGLLMPIKGASHSRRQEQLSPQQDNNSASSKERTERNLWRNDEVLEMMFVMQQTKALDKLNDKQMKSENVFKEVESIMRKKGFVKKSHLQIWTKWKFLKSTYMTSRRNGVVPRMIPPEIYSELHQMVSGASECDTSTNGSINGDNSNANGTGVLGSSGVEADSLPNEEEDDSFGMAHPIFGFRLGLVKHEPIDNGYDTVEKNNDSINENNGLEEISAPQAKIDKQKAEKEKPVEKVVVPHRGRGRPPKKLPWVASTPNNTPTSTAPGTNTQLPPLRVAPFAKATNATNALASSRPPPPLTMPPISRPIRVTNISDISDSNKSESRPLRLIQPKLLPKPQGTHPIRLAKDISAHSGRASTTPSPSYPKLKQVPMRKTPYSLRPDRAIPDLDESFSPPPAPEKQRKLEEVPSTSHLVMQSHSTNGIHENVNPRKRRIDQQQSQPIPTKLRKIPSDDDEPQIADRDRSLKDEHMYGKVMQTAIVELSASLRKTQTQMMREFFNKQHELLEKEHAFQMQQDRLIMETFHLQTQEIMSSVRDLVATIASDKKGEQQRLASKKRAAKERRLQNRQQDRRLFANEESSQETQEHPMNGQTTELEQDSGGQQQQMEHEAEEMYTDEEELNTTPDHDRNESNTNLEEEMHNVFEASDNNQQDDQPLIDQTSSPLGQHQAEGNVEEEDDDDDDEDEDEDDEDEDDDDDDDDEDSDSDDDDDDNGSSQLVNGDEDDGHGHVLPNLTSVESAGE